MSTTTTTIPHLTAADLDEQIAQLTKQQADAIATVHALDGALQIVRALRARLEAPAAAEAAPQDADPV